MSDAAITILVSEHEKAEYRHWCIDHTDGNMSAALRLLVQAIIEYKPTAENVVYALAMLSAPEALSVLAGEDGT